MKASCLGRELHPPPWASSGASPSPREQRPYRQCIAALCASGGVAAIQVKLADIRDAFGRDAALGDEGPLELVARSTCPLAETSRPRSPSAALD